MLSMPVVDIECSIRHLDHARRAAIPDNRGVRGPVEGVCAGGEVDLRELPGFWLVSEFHIMDLIKHQVTAI